MTPQQKALDILNKMNGREITSKEWASASDYAKKDLRRKCLIVADEVLGSLKIIGVKAAFWEKVKTAINSDLTILETVNQPTGANNQE